MVLLVGYRLCKSGKAERNTLFSVGFPSFGGGVGVEEIITVLTPFLPLKSSVLCECFRSDFT